MKVNIELISESIAAFARKLGIANERLIDAEEIDTFSFYENEFPKGSFEDLEVEDFTSLVEALGDSVSVVFERGIEVARFSKGKNLAEELESLKDATKESTNATINWSIDKTELFPVVGLSESEHVRFIQYLFGSRFERLLQDSLSNPLEFEQALWQSNVIRKSVVILYDRDFSASGEFLDIIGKSTTEISGVTVPSQKRCDVLLKQFQSCRNSVRWEQEWLEFLTPDRLVISSSFENDSIYKLISGLATNVSLLFVADRVRNPNGDIHATFATEKSRCNVPFIKLDDINNTTFSPEHCWEVASLANWAYGDKWEPDRIRFVQLAVANALVSEKKQSAVELLWRAKGIRENLAWQWKSFMSERVEQYTAEERSLEGEVAETVARVDSQVSDLIKGISGTVLGAVGVFIGTFIAAAFKDTFNDRLFGFGIYAYAVYVLIFPGIYSMMHSLQAYRATIRLYESRRKRLEQVLGEAKTGEVIGSDVQNAETRFKIWFGLSIGALVAILLICMYVRNEIPEYYKPKEADQKQAVTNLIAAPPLRQTGAAL